MIKFIEQYFPYFPKQMHKSKVTNEVFDGGIFQKSKGQVKKAFMKQFQFVIKLCPRQLEKNESYNSTNP